MADEREELAAWIDKRVEGEWIIDLGGRTDRAQLTRIAAALRSAPTEPTKIRAEWVDGGLVVSCDHGMPSAVNVNGEHFAPPGREPEGERVEGSVVQSDDPKIRWLWRPWYDGFSYERPATLTLHARPVAK